MNKRIPHLIILTTILAQLYGQGGGQGYGNMVILEIPFTHTDELLEGGNNNWDFTNYNTNSADNEDYSFTLNVLDTVIIDISVCNDITDFDSMLGVFRKTPDSTYVDTNLVCIYPDSGMGLSLLDCFAEDTQACTQAIGGDPPPDPNYKSVIYGYVLLPDSNRALDFDGTDDYVDVPHDNALNISDNNGNQGTIMAHIKLDDITSDNFRRIISKKLTFDETAGYELDINPNNGSEGSIITLLAGGDNFARGSFTPSTEWIYIVATFNSTSANIYLDGVDITTDGNIDAITSNTRPLWIGAVSDDPSNINKMDGQIDEIAIWDTELSAAEVAEIYNNGVPKNANIDVGSYTSSSSLVSYWRFNEESGNTVQDVSINDNSGIINGGSTRIANGTTAATYYIVVDSYSAVSGTNNFQINVAYTVPPFITGYTLDSLNSYVDITINENTYNSATPWDGATPLAQENFIISNFQQNGGTAPEPEINGISDTDGNPLVGGELTIRVALDTLIPPSSGIETFEIKPVNNTSIYDGGGTPMEDTTSTGLITLNGAGVMIIESILEDDNSYITIMFNDTVYTDEAATEPLESIDFNLIFNQNTGNATNVTISSLTDVNGEVLTSGVDTLRIYLNIINSPASGAEYFIIQPDNNSSIYNKYNVPMLTNATTGDVSLNDKLAPSITETNIQENNNVSFTTSERLYKTNLSEEVDEDNFLFDLDNSPLGSNAETLTINSVTTPDAASTIYLYTLNLYISPLPSGVETVYFYSNQTAAIYDSSGNELVDSTAIVTLNDKLPPILELENSLLEESNSYVILTFTEGLYTNDNGNNPVTPSDFIANIITIDNATTASITSTLDPTGSALSGGETSIRLNISYDNPPSGVETMEIKPQENQVFDSAGNAVVDTNDITFTLNDALAPSVSFDPENNSLIYPNEVFILTISEDVQLLNDSPVNSTNIDSQLTVAYIDGSAENISFSAIIENNVITITPGSDLGEVRQVHVSILDGLEDLSNNQMDIHTAEYTVRDISPPEINTTFSSIITSNSFVILSFSENVYTNDNGTGALQISDFSLDFSDNGGIATAATISDLQRPGPSGPLLGSEDSIWVYLSITGTPSGDETIVIQSNGNEAIFDGSGNPLSSPNNSTNTITLNPYPRLTDDSLDDENGYVDLVFSEGIFSASDSSSAVEPGDFNLNFSQNSGNAIDATIVTLSKTNGAPLTGGESTIRAVFSFSSPPASGVETIQITPVNAYAVCNSLGNRLSISDCTVNLTLFDRLPPDITDVTMTADTVVSISVSEGMFNNEFGTGAVNAEDFHLEFYANNGNATNAQFINVSNTSQGPLTGGETTILIGFVTDLLPSGSEEIALSPASSSSIYDPAGNPMPVTMISSRVTLPDRLPPMIIAPTSNISSDNTYVIFTLTEGVYGSNETTIPVEPNDFVVEFIQNGGNATGAEVDYITNSRQFPVIGGEDTLRCYLAIQGTPSGHERLYIRAASDNSVFDGAGNGLRVSYPTDTLQLFDQLVPTVDSVSIAHGSPISSSIASPINITFSEPIQSFGYSVSARYYNYLTYIVDTTTTGFKLTLQPPLASLDTITLSIFNLTDSAGLEAVDFSYEFYTPPLGDYDIDGRVNVEDLSQFVSFWMADSQPAILGLGPTSGTFPHLVPILDEEYNLDDGMTFIRMWSWSLDRFGLEPLASPTIGVAINWNKLIVDVPMEAIAGQVYLRYNPNQGKVDLSNTAFGNNNFTLKREVVENGEILLEFGLVEPDEDARVISIKPEVDEPAEATVIYKFFAQDQSIIAAGTQKISLVIPTEFRLMQNYPNPFNNTTTIRYAVPKETFVQLEIFDINGRLVETLKSDLQEPGFYAIKWSGHRVASGIYFIKLEADKTLLTQKMILLK